MADSRLPPLTHRQPQVHWQVYFMKLALDPEAYVGRPLPPAPQSKFLTRAMLLSEKGWVLRLIVALLGKAMDHDSILPSEMTHHWHSLTTI